MLLLGVCCSLSSASVVVVDELASFVDSEVRFLSVDFSGSSVSAGSLVPAVVTDSDFSASVVA